jgi:hypothetical protein
MWLPIQANFLKAELVPCNDIKLYSIKDDVFLIINIGGKKYSCFQMLSALLALDVEY